MAAANQSPSRASPDFHRSRTGFPKRGDFVQLGGNLQAGRQAIAPPHLQMAAVEARRQRTYLAPPRRPTERRQRAAANVPHAGQRARTAGLLFARWRHRFEHCASQRDPLGMPLPGRLLNARKWCPLQQRPRNRLPATLATLNNRCHGSSDRSGTDYAEVPSNRGYLRSQLHDLAELGPLRIRVPRFRRSRVCLPVR